MQADDLQMVNLLTIHFGNQKPLDCLIHVAPLHGPLKACNLSNKYLHEEIYDEV